MSEDRCVCCGELVPEGRMVCPACEKRAEKERDLAEELVSKWARGELVERKKGKWIAQKGGGYRCSECKHYALDERDGNLIHVSAKTKFCPYCGADMREGKPDDH